MSDPAFGLVLVSSDGGWSRSVSDTLRRRGLERLVLATPHTLADGIDGNAAVVVDGRLAGEQAASVIRAVNAVRSRRTPPSVLMVEAETIPADPGLAELADWRDTRLPDDEELTALLASAPAVAHAERSPELCRALVGSSEPILQIRALIERVAPTEVTVLITGESGSGKEVVARNIHFRSTRRPHPFVALNCALLPAGRLIEELFGSAAKPGCLERAAGGTLFLDGIALLPHEAQARLLRTLQTRKFEREGAADVRELDVRLIVATDTDLNAEVASRRFRSDLYYRLSVFPIRMPALRERYQDIPPLFAELVARQRADSGREIRLTAPAMQLLQKHSWPGNVRELANLVERLAILYPGAEIDGSSLARHLPATKADSPSNGVALPAGRIDLRGFVRDIERRLIERALREANGVTAHAATLLNMRRTTLMHKMKTLRPERYVAERPARVRKAGT